MEDQLQKFMSLRSLVGLRIAELTIDPVMVLGAHQLTPGGEHQIRSSRKGVRNHYHPCQSRQYTRTVPLLTVKWWGVRQRGLTVVTWAAADGWPAGHSHWLMGILPTFRQGCQSFDSTLPILPSECALPLSRRSSAPEPTEAAIL